MSPRPGSSVRPMASGVDRWFNIKTQIHSKLLSSLSPDQLRSLNKDGIREQIGNVVERIVKEENIPMTGVEREQGDRAAGRLRQHSARDALLGRSDERRQSQGLGGRNRCVRGGHVQAWIRSAIPAPVK